VGRALGVSRARLLRFVLLDHDEPAGHFLQRVELNARWAVNPAIAASKAAVTAARCPGTGQAVTVTTLIQMLSRYGARNAVSAASISWGASLRQ
jgi:hypothetical protein